MIIQGLELRKRNIIKDIPLHEFFISGVYVLKLGDTIIYIGQSKSVYSRIIHHKRKMMFSSVSVIIITDEVERLALEKELIAKHPPKYNITHNSEYC